MMAFYFFDPLPLGQEKRPKVLGQVPKDERGRPKSSNSFQILHSYYVDSTLRTTAVAAASGHVAAHWPTPSPVVRRTGDCLLLQ